MARLTENLYWRNGTAKEDYTRGYEENILDVSKLVQTFDAP